jgi:DNA polymerase-3 subunit epsilon
MNPRARATLGTGPSTGIGAPLSRIVPPARLDHHLRRLRAAWDERRSAVESVLFPLTGGKVLRGGITGIAEPGGARAGFLFVFRDVTADAARDLKVEEALRELPLKLKGPLASISSMVDILSSRTDLPDAKRAAFLTALDEEVDRCLAEVEKGQRATVDVRSARWPAQPVDPRELVESALALVPGVFARHDISVGETFPPVAVEPYGWIAALATSIRWLATHSSGWKPLEARLDVEDEMIVITFHLTGDVSIEPAELEALLIESPGEDPYSLGEAVRRNHGEIWTRRTGEGFEVRLGMMRASVLPQGREEQSVFDDQPEFYDFDLFLTRPGAEAADKLASNLWDLEYVVFDTETTGLSPSQGDRVVSLSAVRIRNGKVNRADAFHTLVHPGIPIPPSSIAFHGITDDMVRGAPPMAKVLPQFAQYVGKAVLVGHNVAFDKKFLDLAAAEARLPLMENPVLDTLFLSYGVHGDLEGHNLDAIAARLGVAVEGRHTSTGDARATADVFLHLMELLPSRGVRTLAEAKAFCDKMLLLRWQMSRY